MAVVASVFDDVLASSIADDGRDSLELEDVRVGPAGAAFLGRPAALEAMTPLLFEALGADLPGDAVPPGAWGLFDRLTSDDASEHPADAEQLRQWLRDCLGGPATHEEVRDCVFHALMGGEDVHELETLPPHVSDEPLPVPEPAAEEGVVSLPPERPAPEVLISTDVVRRRTALPEATLLTEVDADPPSAVRAAREADPAATEILPAPEYEEDESEVPTPELAPPSELEAHALSDEDSSSEHPTVREGSDPNRPVVRHQTPRRSIRPVSVLTAPAARRSARAAGHGPDSILVGADHRVGWAWVTVAAVVAAAVYFLFFR